MEIFMNLVPGISGLILIFFAFILNGEHKITIGLLKTFLFLLGALNLFSCGKLLNII